MILKASRLHKKTPVKFTLITLFHVSKLKFSKDPPSITPELFIRMSILSNSWVEVLNKLITSDSLLTSVGTTIALPPDFLIWSRVLFRRSVLREASIKLDPSWANAIAIAFPIPEPAPVIIVVFPDSLFMIPPRIVILFRYLLFIEYLLCFNVKWLVYYSKFESDYTLLI